MESECEMKREDDVWGECASEHKGQTSRCGKKGVNEGMGGMESE